MALQYQPVKGTITSSVDQYEIFYRDTSTSGILSLSSFSVSDYRENSVNSIVDYANFNPNEIGNKKKIFKITSIDFTAIFLALDPTIEKVVFYEFSIARFLVEVPLEYSKYSSVVTIFINGPTSSESINLEFHTNISSNPHIEDLVTSDLVNVSSTTYMSEALVQAFMRFNSEQIMGNILVTSEFNKTYLGERTYGVQ